MPTVDLSEAEPRLAQLVERALAGEEVVIARDGEPLVRLVVLKKPREFGSLAGTVPPEVLEALQAPLPEDVINSFYESEDDEELLSISPKTPAPARKREFGTLRGKGWTAPDAWEPMSEEELALWYESPLFPEARKQEAEASEAEKVD